MSSVDSGYAEAIGAQLYYEVEGEGNPIVLIPGFTLDTRMWDDQFQEFSKHYRVIRYDCRGFGKSSVPEEGKPYSHSRDLKELLDHLNIRKACIIGLSKGGSIAINFTLEYPDYVSSLIAVDSALDGYRWTSKFREWFNSLFRIARESDVESAKEAFMNGPLFQATMRNPIVAARLRQIVRSYSGWRLLYDDPQIDPVPSPHSRLHEIKCPTLAIVGKHDLLDFHEIANKIDREVLDSKKCVLQGVGHMSNMEDHEAFNREVLAFLESLN